MTSDAGEPREPRRPEEELEQANRKRLKRDWELPMSDRLARVHELSRQITTIEGAAKRQ